MVVLELGRWKWVTRGSSEVGVEGVELGQERWAEGSGERGAGKGGKGREEEEEGEWTGVGGPEMEV